MSVIAVITKKRVIYAVVFVLVVFTVLSFVLPYVGGGDSGLTPSP
jgi:hypothetical protein